METQAQTNIQTAVKLQKETPEDTKPSSEEVATRIHNHLGDRVVNVGRGVRDEKDAAFLHIRGVVSRAGVIIRILVRGIISAGGLLCGLRVTRRPAVRAIVGIVNLPRVSGSMHGHSAGRSCQIYCRCETVLRQSSNGGSKEDEEGSVDSGELGHSEA